MAANDPKYNNGQLHRIDEIAHGDETVGVALKDFGYAEANNHRSRLWLRTIGAVENILFSSGRQYLNDLLANRLAVDAAGNMSIAHEISRNIPRPTNDILGRYVETNVALFTENKPIPRITAKSDSTEDKDAAELSELTVEYLWEALALPEAHRELARLVLHTGVAWLEVAWDPTIRRMIKVPQTTTSNAMVIPSPTLPAVQTPLERQVTKYDSKGNPVYSQEVAYGDITSRVVSFFEFHTPSVHRWNDEALGWVLREEYLPMDVIRERYDANYREKGLLKSEGWYVDRLDGVSGAAATSHPLWWYERLSDLVEGPTPGFFLGTPELWNDYAFVRIFDRKPNKKWPNGRTVITVGDKVIYDSPKDTGARAYSPRFPRRWHPYVRYRYEPMVGSIYGRSLVSKLLPLLKRINSIDTALIMWRRTVPVAAWLVPKGASLAEQRLRGGFGGAVWDYEPKRTGGLKPEPVMPPPFPEAMMRERELLMAQMETIAGTESILKGERPVGTTSGNMLMMLRQQVLASKSEILQAWDESMQETGSALLQETVKHIKDQDPLYAEGIRILAREKLSRLTIQTFSGTDLSQNVAVRVDTASMALASKEAREAKVLEFLQYLPGLVNAPLSLRQAIIEELGLSRALTPQGPDVERAKRMISWVKNRQFERLIPMTFDDPYVFSQILIDEVKSEPFWDLAKDQQKALLSLISMYQRIIQNQQQQAMQMQMMMASMGKKPGGGGGGEGEGGAPQGGPPPGLGGAAGGQ